MWINSFRIFNYKCFEETVECCLKPGFNLVVGANNVGKTALLEALSSQFPPKPHRKLGRPREYPLDPESAVEMTVTLTGEECRRALVSGGNAFVPVRYDSDRTVQAQAFLNTLFEATEVPITFRRNHGGQVSLNIVPRHPAFRGMDLECRFAQEFQVLSGHDLRLTRPVDAERAVESFVARIVNYFVSSIYSFKAERLNIGESAYGPNEILMPHAGNLPEVLSGLQGRNPTRFKRLSDYVRSVFPNVEAITARPKTGQSNKVEVSIWNYNPDLERDDLAMPLSECGTGVGQVLAILYVVLTSDTPRCIIIDEPNSFLHPGATRKLMGILAIHPRHQYIIATHSPEVIRAIDASHVVSLRKEGADTVIDTVSTNDLQSIREILGELGARLSDLFGADSILWVEGLTEELCYPAILRSIDPILAAATAVVAVRNTGDFESKRKDPRQVMDIYSRLSTSTVLVPTTVGFIFDRESRSQGVIDDIVRSSSGKARFLERRTYENYLCDPPAIAAVLNELPTFKDNNLGDTGVREWIEKNGRNSTYGAAAGSESVLKDRRWIETVNGAKLLADLFSGLSDGCEEYRKTRDAPKLTDWLIRNNRSALNDIEALLRELTGSQGPSKERGIAGGGHDVSAPVNPTPNK